MLELGPRRPKKERMPNYDKKRKVPVLQMEPSGRAIIWSYSVGRSIEQGQVSSL
jgi:hypothetical protein